jgi:hypothetical protein
VLIRLDAHDIPRLFIQSEVRERFPGGSKAAALASRYEWGVSRGPPNVIHIFETSCSFSSCLFHQQPPLHWAVSSHWPAEKGGILANGERQLYIAGRSNTPILGGGPFRLDSIRPPIPWARQIGYSLSSYLATGRFIG